MAEKHPKSNEPDAAGQTVPFKTAAEESQARGAASSSPESALEEQLRTATAERDANMQNWLRSQADLDNYRKRIAKEMEQDQRYRALPLTRDLLPALDNLHRTLDAARTSADLEKLVQGVQMVIKQFDDIFAKHSIVAIDAVGKPFDANVHQAIQQVPTADKPPMTVLNELERGYLLHDRVVRPSTVIVSSAPAN